MADYSNTVITQAGLELLAFCEANEKKIKFTSFVVGAGTYEEEEKSIEALTHRQELKEVRQSFGYNSIKAEKNVVTLTVLISNEGNSAGYRLTEMGVMARPADDANAEPVLFSVTTVEEPDYIPVENPEAPYVIVMDYCTVISNEVRAKIVAAQTQYALASDLAEMNERLNLMTETSEEDIMHIIDGDYEDDGGVLPDVSDDDADDISDTDFEDEDIDFDDLFNI